MEWFFRCLGFAEKLFAFAQGKGYGSHSIRKEVRCSCKLVDRDVALAIDIGGNVGNYTAELLEVYPSAEVHIFEPSSENVRTLRARFSKNRNIHIDARALSSSDGARSLYFDKPGSGLASLSKRDLSFLGISFEGSELVSATRFETYWVSELNRRKIDMVKIDVEGHELDVLIGFGSALDSVGAIQFEFGGCNLDTKTSWKDFWVFLTTRDFQIFRVSPFGLNRIYAYREADEYYSTTNYIAVSPITRGVSKV